MANTVTFKPKQVTKRMLSHLPDRAYEVVTNRFGLTDDAQRKTLEAIGKKFIYLSHNLFIFCLVIQII